MEIGGEILGIYSDGNQTRDFIYANNLVRATRLVINADRIDGEVSQIATDAETSIAALIQELVSILSTACINDVKLIHSEPRQGDIRRYYSEISVAKKRQGWNAEHNLTKGLKKTVEWFKIH